MKHNTFNIEYHMFFWAICSFIITAAEDVEHHGPILRVHIPTCQEGPPLSILTLAHKSVITAGQKTQINPLGVKESWEHVTIIFCCLPIGLRPKGILSWLLFSPIPASTTPLILPEILWIECYAMQDANNPIPRFFLTHGMSSLIAIK